MQNSCTLIGFACHGIAGGSHSYVGRQVYVPLVQLWQCTLAMNGCVTTTWRNLRRSVYLAAFYFTSTMYSDWFSSLFLQIKLPKDIPDELLYGRVGYLWACSFINKNIGQGTISSSKMVRSCFLVLTSKSSSCCTILGMFSSFDFLIMLYTYLQRAVVDDVIRSGRKMAKGRCPLMYEWHGKKYWGAAHGLAGIMHVLMDMELKPDELEDVKYTLRFMIRNRFPSGNYRSSEGSESDRLVHWCHGAPGLALTLTKAAKVNCIPIAKFYFIHFLNTCGFMSLQNISKYIYYIICLSP